MRDNEESQIEVALGGNANERAWFLSSFSWRALPIRVPLRTALHRKRSGALPKKPGAHAGLK